MITTTLADVPEAASDTRIDPQVRDFLADLNKDSSPFWELPQPKPQQILTALQNKTSVDMSGVTTAETTITQDGRTVKLYIMKPLTITGKPHGSVRRLDAHEPDAATARWRGRRPGGLER